MKKLASVMYLALLANVGCGAAAKEIDPQTPVAPDGDLTGNVRSAAGDPVEGVVVSRKVASLPALEVTTVTDRAGVYRFANLAPGTYSLRIEKEGCRVLAEKDIVLRPYSTERVDMQLQPADASPDVKAECARSLPVADRIPVRVPSGKGGTNRPIITVAGQSAPGGTVDSACPVLAGRSSCGFTWTAPSGTRFCYLGW
jgi:hypothetical protein